MKRASIISLGPILEINDDSLCGCFGWAEQRIIIIMELGDIQEIEEKKWRDDNGLLS